MKDLPFKERIEIRGRNGKSMKLKLNSWKSVYRGPLANLITKGLC